MPIPLFQSGEVLSAMRLNALVQVVNDATAVMESFSYPFQQVELYETSLIPSITWNWMFRYSPTMKYYKLRYLWQDRQPLASAVGKISGTTVFTDAAGGASGQHDRLIDLSTAGLIEGKIYTLDLTVNLADSTFFRVIWAFMTNNSAYAPTIIQ